MPEDIGVRRVGLAASDVIKAHSSRCRCTRTRRPLGRCSCRCSPVAIRLRVVSERRGLLKSMTVRSTGIFNAQIIRDIKSR